MTKLEAYEAAEATFDAAAKEMNFARAALARSKSKANIARFIAADEAFNIALAANNAARDAYEAAVEAAEMLAAVEAAKTTETQLVLF